MPRDLYGNKGVKEKKRAESMGGVWCVHMQWRTGMRSVAQPGGKAGGRRLLGTVDINPNMSLQEQRGTGAQ